jgi:CheY-like chemotaxis protein
MQTALVVEDDRAIRDLMGELLREQGFKSVLTAGTPDDAIALARTNSIDLVVLDYLLGGHSGIEVAERLRSLPGFGASVLVTTALPQKQAENVCAQANACECLTKPFDITDFLEAVQSCLHEGAATP